MLLLDTQRDVLLYLLQSVTGVVEKRHTMPILSNVLIDQHKQILSVMASDQEIQIRVSTTVVPGYPDFAITVAARKIYDICRALNGNPTVTLYADQQQLQIRAVKSRFNLQTLPAIDFPIIQTPEQSNTAISLSQKEFKNLVMQVQYAMAQQDVRYYLNGMLLVLDPDQLVVVATDGHRLCLAAQPLETGNTHQEIILPRKTINELVKLLADNDELLTITLYTNQVKFEFGSIQLISKVIDGKFPDYHRVIPTTHKNLVTVNRVVIQQALQRAAILSNEKYRGVRLVLSQNELKIICNNNEQEEAEEEINVEYRGDPLDIGFNVTYLLDALNQLSAENIICHFGDASSSMLITISEDASYKYVIMPMRI